MRKSDIKKQAFGIKAICSNTNRPFGITVEKRGNDCHFTWAFRLTDSSARREGFDKATVRGNIYNDESYPGCIHCGNKSWYQCGHCGAFCCMHETQEGEVTCPACGTKLKLAYGDNFELGGSSF